MRAAYGICVLLVSLFFGINGGTTAADSVGGKVVLSIVFIVLNYLAGWAIWYGVAAVVRAIVVKIRSSRAMRTTRYSAPATGRERTPYWDRVSGTTGPSAEPSSKKTLRQVLATNPNPIGYRSR